ncbi:MAG: phenylacetic acid degradation operon negative regulatory protein PaaX [Inquilinus limosus]|uniref:Phenylacetic acid degradation operon negative regulatory protein PaaX n=1 Tax=Inquilinus limosus TaxID=171674 RepID=A0A952FM48_9PROT|nr:phenylacetic acid degradation operon negative regulatory protein PaaX [Inquilinus limosus]
MPDPRTALRRILDSLKAEPSRTWSIIITIYGDAIVPRGGSLWLGTLSAVLHALDIGDGVVRTAMSRLAADGWLERSRIGRNSFYRLAERGRETFRTATEHIYNAHPPPPGSGFELVLLGNGGDREAARSALQDAGFGSAGPGVWVAPAGTAIPPVAADALRLDATADAETRRRLAAQSWPLDQTAAAYRHFLAEFEPLREALAAGGALPDQDSFIARILLIHAWRRIVLRDPVLPADLLPPDWPGTAARALCADLYHRLLPASERWLDGHGQAESGSLPPPGPELQARFR